MHADRRQAGADRWPTSYGDCIRTLGLREGPCGHKLQGHQRGPGVGRGPGEAVRASGGPAETRGRMARSPRVWRSAGSLGRWNPEAGLMRCPAPGSGGRAAQNECRSKRGRRRLSGLEAGAVVVGGHSASFLETNGTSPMRSPDASQVSQRRPPLQLLQHLSADPGGRTLRFSGGAPRRPLQTVIRIHHDPFNSS
jgi:hypothetical protein